MKGWLRDELGIRVAITPGGVLLGRSRSCGIVIADPAVSRRHAAVLAGLDAVHVVPLSEQGVEVRGERRHVLTEVADGDELKVGAERFLFELEAPPPPVSWQLGIGDRRYPVLGRSFTLGGGPDDDLVVSSWPPRACTLYAFEQSLHLDTAAPFTVVGAQERDGLYLLTQGARFGRGAVEVVLVKVPEEATTVERPRAPTEAVLEFVPNGALLRMKVSGAPCTVFLAQRRADLVAALLSPARGTEAGAWVEDEVLMRRVWGREGASRVQLNVLLHRVRESLTHAGLNGAVLVQRAPGGGAVRFRLADGARVAVR